MASAIDVQSSCLFNFGKNVPLYNLDIIENYVSFALLVYFGIFA